MQLDMPALYQSEGEAPVQRLAAALNGPPSRGNEAASLQALSGIVWTPSMRRMYTLVDRSDYSEARNNDRGCACLWT